MLELIVSKRFEKDLSKLLKSNPRLEKKVEKTLNLLIKNPKYPSLRLHKLSGLGENYSISVDMNIRIIINIEDGKIFLLRIGSHDEVY